MSPHDPLVPFDPTPVPPPSGPRPETAPAHLPPGDGPPRQQPALAPGADAGFDPRCEGRADAEKAERRELQRRVREE
jgi:hypothetical protein